MTDETYTFEQTRVRLDGILVEVRKKDTSLEQSLELLEEGVRLLNQCNELIDQTAWRPPTASSAEGEGEAGPQADGTPVADGVAADDDDPESAEAEDGSDADADPPVAAASAFDDDERD